MDKKFKIGLIRVLTTEDQEDLQAHGRQIMEYFPTLEVETTQNTRRLYSLTTDI